MKIKPTEKPFQLELFKKARKEAESCSEMWSCPEKDSYSLKSESFPYLGMYMGDKKATLLKVFRYLVSLGAFSLFPLEWKFNIYYNKVCSNPWLYYK